MVDMVDNFNTSQDTSVSKDTLWYLDNYIRLRDYLDRTISRIAARCIRLGNIAVEEYPFYGYILDVLEEICDTGDLLLEHKEIYPYIEKKITGGVNGLKKELKEYKQELRSNASPDMIKQDDSELEKMKKALGEVDKTVDPTVGAGMSMDEVVDKILRENSTTLGDMSQYATHNSDDDNPPIGIVPPDQKPGN